MSIQHTLVLFKYHDVIYCIFQLYGCKSNTIIMWLLLPKSSNLSKVGSPTYETFLEIIYLGGTRWV